MNETGTHLFRGGATNEHKASRFRFQSDRVPGSHPVVTVSGGDEVDAQLLRAATVGMNGKADGIREVLFDEAAPGLAALDDVVGPNAGFFLEDTGGFVGMMVLLSASALGRRRLGAGGRDRTAGRKRKRPRNASRGLRKAVVSPLSQAVPDRSRRSSPIRQGRCELRVGMHLGN